VDKKLGEGSFGEVTPLLPPIPSSQVFRVQSRDDHRWYAVKRSIEVFRNDADRQLKLREVQKHELLPANANLVAFIAAWEDRGRLYIQYELCEYRSGERNRS
jgi:serine/threonine protein kinase